MMETTIECNKSLEVKVAGEVGDYTSGRDIANISLDNVNFWRNFGLISGATSIGLFGAAFLDGATYDFYLDGNVYELTGQFLGRAALECGGGFLSGIYSFFSAVFYICESENYRYYAESYKHFRESQDEK